MALSTAETDFDANSTDEASATGSDIEQLLVSGDWSGKEYCLGKKYFDFALTAQLVKQSDADEGLAELGFRETHPIYASLVLTLGSPSCSEPRQGIST